MTVYAYMSSSESFGWSGPPSARSSWALVVPSASASASAHGLASSSAREVEGVRRDADTGDEETFLRVLAQQPHPPSKSAA